MARLETGDRTTRRLPRRRVFARRGVSTLAALVCVGVLAVIELGLGAEQAAAAVGHGFLSSLSEAPVGSRLAEPGAVAVDHASGDVFVADLGAEGVDVFDSSGAFVGRLGEEVEAAAIAVDEASGDVFVAEPFEDEVLVYRPDGSGAFALAGNGPGLRAQKKPSAKSWVWLSTIRKAQRRAMFMWPMPATARCTRSNRRSKVRRCRKGRSWTACRAPARRTEWRGGRPGERAGACGR